MRTRHERTRLRPGLAMALAAAVYLTPARRSDGEDRFDSKVLFYLEGDGRMQIIAPSILFERSLSRELTVRVDGIYNSISGATPTGAPPIPRTIVTPSRAALTDASAYHAKAGATGSSSGGGGSGKGKGKSKSRRNSRGGGRSPVPTTTTRSLGPLSSTTSFVIPMADVSDSRLGANAEIARDGKAALLAAGLSASREADFDSLGLSLRNGLYFNDRNTVLLGGLGYTHDILRALTLRSDETKDTVDVMIGLRQILGRQTIGSLNLSCSRVEGFLSDPYKVADVNGILVPERRPDLRDKAILLVSLTQGLEALDASVEAGYRLYADTFGVLAGTYSLTWLQRVSETVVIEPMMRVHDQIGADFYGVRFAGDPAAYSSDYRLSSLIAVSLGGQIVVTPAKEWSVTAGYERYRQTGKDGVTVQEVYPVADILTVGARWWF